MVKYLIQGFSLDGHYLGNLEAPKQATLAEFAYALSAACKYYHDGVRMLFDDSLTTTLTGGAAITAAIFEKMELFGDVPIHTIEYPEQRIRHGSGFIIWGLNFHPQIAPADFFYVLQQCKNHEESPKLFELMQSMQIENFNLVKSILNL